MKDESLINNVIFMILQLHRNRVSLSLYIMVFSHTEYENKLVVTMATNHSNGYNKVIKS